MNHTTPLLLRTLFLSTLTFLLLQKYTSHYDVTPEQFGPHKLWCKNDPTLLLLPVAQSSLAHRNVVRR